MPFVVMLSALPTPRRTERLGHLGHLNHLGHIKMASRNRKRYTVREVWDEILNDSNSDMVQSDSESENENGNSEDADNIDLGDGNHNNSDSNDGSDVDNHALQVPVPTQSQEQQTRGRPRIRGCAPGRAPRGRAEARNNAPARQAADARGNDDWVIDNSDTVVPDFTGQPGLQVPQPNSPDGWFELFFKEDDFEYIAEQTNLYFHQFLDSKAQDQIARKARVRDWVDTNADELKLFFAISFAMGLVTKPTIHSYWSVDKVLLTPYFGATKVCAPFPASESTIH